jgi:ubiquinone biosynthesis protein
MRLRPRHLRRYRQIVEILADYGFGAVLRQLGISERLNLPRRVFRRQPSVEGELSTARRVRLAMEELGPTFVKLGQILSTRADLLPPEFLDELVYLQDQVAPGPWEEAREVIETDLGKPIHELFASIDPTPLASASIAQVHSAVLFDGREVVIKIQRPGIDKVIALDLDILYDLAQLVQSTTSLADRFDPVGLAEEFAASIQAELDFRREGRNADRFRVNFAKEEFIYVPQVHWEYTSKRVIVLERIYGIKISDISALEAAGNDRHELATNAAQLILKEVLEDGFFHADPHPGNLLIMPGGVLGVLDYGIVGRLEPSDRYNLGRLFVNVIQMDVEGIVDQLMRMGIVDYRVNRIALQREMKRMLIQYHGLPISEIDAKEVLDGLDPIIYRHQLRVPSDYWLLGKTVAVMQGVGLELDPEFDIFEASQPYLGRLFRQNLMPSTWGPELLKRIVDWNDLVSGFPRHANRILDQLERGDLGVVVEIPELRETINEMDIIANRIIFAVIIAALIVALAFLIPRLDFSAWPWPLVTWVILITFLVLCAAGMWLLWSIFRSSRRRNRRH